VGALIVLVVGIQRIGGVAAANRPILILGALLIGLGVQAFSVGLLGELLLYFQAKRDRPYRIAEVYERGDSTDA
jgi:hypothetical protein